MHKYLEDLYKEKRLEKQGLKYSLNLGQNTGAYLQKDVMLENQRSLRLLVSDEVMRNNPKALSQTADTFVPKAIFLQEPPEMYDEEAKMYINYDERYKAKFFASENLTSSTLFSTVHQIIHNDQHLLL